MHVRLEPVVDEQTAASSAVVPLQLTGIAKSFGSTHAVRSFDFDLRKGEVHAIMGENGSGKSTIVKILTGVHTPDAGTILRCGADIRFATPRASLDAGIVAVFQEVLVVPPRSVLENVWLGADGMFSQALSTSDKRAIAERELGDLLPNAPSLSKAAEDISLSDRQACCIVRALVRKPEILILDEATSALDIATRDRLFATLRRIVQGGTAVIFISHRMDEIREIADRVTVMRSGRSVATLSHDEATPAKLVKLMTGEEHATGDAANSPARASGEVVLRVRDLALRPGARSIDLDIRSGEVLGLAGLEGHGQDAFLQALAGLGLASGSVAGEVHGDWVSLSSPREADEAGVVLVPRERRNDALFPTLSVLENFAVMTLSSDARFGVWRPRRSAKRFAEYIQLMGIKFGRLSDPITTLSGGNQQKVVIARALAAKPRVLLLNDPTRGVDIGAKMDIYRLLIDLAARDIAIVMLSTEIDEHIELMDRVVVFREAELAAEFDRAALTRDGLLSSFFGGRARAVG